MRQADYQSAAGCHPAPHGPIANRPQAASLHHRGQLWGGLSAGSRLPRRLFWERAPQ
jgi:hypothetical protein